MKKLLLRMEGVIEEVYTKKIKGVDTKLLSTKMYELAPNRENPIEFWQMYAHLVPEKYLDRLEEGEIFYWSIYELENGEQIVDWRFPKPFVWTPELKAEVEKKAKEYAKLLELHEENSNFGI